MFINEKAGYLQDWITQLWVKVSGRSFDPEKEEWLTGPVGSTRIIKDKFIQDLAAREDLTISENEYGSGLIEDMSALGFTEGEKATLNPRITNFYQHTSNYNFEIWSEWCGFFKPFGWLLSVIFSRRLQQLNLPLSSIQSAKGIKSSIIKLKGKRSGETKWTVWFRILKSTQHVIYSGVYTVSSVPNISGKFLKVIFPLPNGNATVIMRKDVLPDGSLKLTSDGQKFGDNGFYFTLTNHKGKYWARFVKAMHEWITVYEDDEKELRADHVLQFHGLTFLKLHYKMVEKQRNFENRNASSEPSYVNGEDHTASKLVI
jgi:hypothetical protein